MENYKHFDNGDAHLPAGFRFHPTDEELITCYLLKKVLDSNFSDRVIVEVDFNKCEPWELPEKAKMGEKEWYFFSMRERKYPTGLKTNRATGAGYWKATGKDKDIYSSKTCSLLGMKKTLVFYRGRAPTGEKSNWVMHEYRLEGNFAYHYLTQSCKNEWVISRVYQKSGDAGATNITQPRQSCNCTNNISLYNEPSSTNLPGSAHTAGSANQNTIDSHWPPPSLVDPLGRLHINMNPSPFPSLLSPPENFQPPFFFSSQSPAVAPSQTFNIGGGPTAVNWMMAEEDYAGARVPAELDSMWNCY